MNTQYAALMVSATMLLCSCGPTKNAPSESTQNPLAPLEGEIHVPTEMRMYNQTTHAQQAGMHLAAPGDMVRYTYVISNAYSQNPNYELSRALFGVHVLDEDRDQHTIDTDEEWASILINGRPRSMLGSGQSSEFFEVASDTERDGMPIGFAGADLIENNTLVLEITNRNAEGGITLDGEWGDFTFLRGGLHLYYKRAE